jgi:threonine aldolase
LCLENTHNFAGGTCLSAASHKSLVKAAHEKGLKVHLDGARVWHAFVATGDSLDGLCWGAETVSVCLSKGLGAPIGSLLVGSRAIVEEARRIRKMLGGGVRQGGVVAAAGLVALDYIPRLAEDHAKAAELADGLLSLGFKAAKPETNILIIPVPRADEGKAKLDSVGIRVLTIGNALRFIAHRDLAAADIPDAIEKIKPIADDILSS